MANDAERQLRQRIGNSQRRLDRRDDRQIEVDGERADQRDRGESQRESSVGRMAHARSLWLPPCGVLLIDRITHLEAGIDPDDLTDRQLVEQVSRCGSFG